MFAVTRVWGLAIIMFCVAIPYGSRSGIRLRDPLVAVRYQRCWQHVVGGRKSASTVSDEKISTHFCKFWHRHGVLHSCAIACLLFGAK